MLLDYATTDIDAPVRECPLCPPWVECAHFGDQVVWLASCESESWTAHQLACAVWGRHRTRGREVTGPSLLAERGDWCWPRYMADLGSLIDFDTEAEARAEFERRVALMLGREAE